MNPDTSNTAFQQAINFVNQTNKHLFITGKAGTGKTTFLRYIKEHSFKKMAVVAPTGVAAINAGGVTIHSFFQLPFGAFVPGYNHNMGNYGGEVNNATSLLRNLRIPSAKRTLIRELDLLVIDEVSMVRADLLDAIDTVARHIRRQPLTPFGGMQVVYIGDLFQLPPVTKNDEWQLLSNYYKTPFFFSAQVIQNTAPLFIELKKIYRQKDDTFIHILNNIRNNSCSYDDLEYLHQYYKPGYVPAKEENFITLTSHNGKADDMNQTALQNLSAKTFIYKAEIDGDFVERMFPAEKDLRLKVGAQVMFIKNDKGEARRYYNGKIATVSYLSPEIIKVRFAGEDEELEVEKEVWKNIRYNYKEDDDVVNEEELGNFKQYPIRLAWAITIHKSQGLTFEKAIIDAGASFAPGQVYVSLSRLTGLQGLILYSRILPHTISTDERVIEFVNNQMDDAQLEETLEAERTTFAKHNLLTGFEWNRLVDVCEDHYNAYQNRNLPEKEKCIEFSGALLQLVKAHHVYAVKFRNELVQLFATSEQEGFKTLHDRVQKASAWFQKELQEKLIEPLKQQINWINGKGKVKKYVKELNALLSVIDHKTEQLQQSASLAEAMLTAASPADVVKVIEQQRTSVVSTTANAEANHQKVKRQKGDTQKLSLQLFKQGKSIPDIATERGFAASTVEGHLAGFIQTGAIDVLDLVPNEKLQHILAAINKLSEETTDAPLTSTTVKQVLPSEYSFGEIRAAMNFMEWKQRSGVADSTTTTATKQV